MKQLSPVLEIGVKDGISVVIINFKVHQNLSKTDFREIKISFR